MFLSDAAKRAAVVDFCVAVVRIFYGADMFRLTGSTLTLGSDMPEHVDHVRRCLARAAESYDPADCATPGTLSHFGKRMLEVGLVGEAYDEVAGRWTIESDGAVMRGLLRRWDVLHRTSTRSSGGIVSLFPADCPLDASLVPILAYLLMNGDEGARDQLRREMAAAGEQMGQIAPAGVPSHFYGLVLGAHNVVAFGDYLGTYLRILKKNPRGIGQHRGGVGLSGGQAW